MKRIITGIMLAILLKIINSCQGLIEMIPTDFEEKLCVTAILNDFKDQNIIIVEKSYQNEYPSEIKAHLEDLSVKIISESEVVFEYFNPKSENRIDTIHLPSYLKYVPNQKYTLTISEKNSETVVSEIVVPYSPSELEVGIEGMVQTFLPPPAECHNPIKSVLLEIKFKSEKNLFYYIDIDGYMDLIYKDTLRYLIDYDILESNSSYFKTFLHGFRSIGFRSCLPTGGIPINIYQPCFLDSRTISEKTCNVIIKIDINDEYYDYSKPISINLNSIPMEFYNYEKSYHTYVESYFDPFSEPVYLVGNIKGGNGIFAICSSKQYSLFLPTN